MNAERFYLNCGIASSPSVCYYSEVSLRQEILYEYIINRHFYLSARTGVSLAMKGGLYTKSRKDLVLRDASGNILETTIQQDRSPIPFFNISVSYSLFK